jgi:uncharacterized protein
MGKNLAALAAGLIFGLGLAVSQMINPLKVLAFLDFFGHWDPSLAFVILAAIAVSALGFRLLRSRGKPVFAQRFEWPTRRDPDAPLIWGAAVFGIGWGLGGYCPGPGIAALALGFWEPFVFTVSMGAGFLAWHFLRHGCIRWRTQPADG